MPQSSQTVTYRIPVPHYNIWTTVDSSDFNTFIYRYISYSVFISKALSCTWVAVLLRDAATQEGAPRDDCLVIISGWSMRLFTGWLGASGPCDWVTSPLLSFSPCQKGLVGQTEWSQYFPECAGTSQSPIDVVSTQTKYDPSLTPVTPLGYSQLGHRPFTLSNNGHTGKYVKRAWYPSSLTADLFILPRPRL